MERLTNKREADAQREGYERRLANGYQRSIPVERILRLAAYEDSGLEPKEVLPKDKADEIALKLMRLANLESICSYTRLRELAEADKDGRLAVTRWIPVTERLPEDSVKECIIFVPRVPENIVGVGRYLGSGRWVIDGWYLTPEAVVYWMPLPEAPHEKALEAMNDG